MKNLRNVLLCAESVIRGLSCKGIFSDYPDLKIVDKSIHDIRVNSKLGAFKAFDQVNKSEQFLLATEKDDCTISVIGHSDDEFDLELAYGILRKYRNRYGIDALQRMFDCVMEGDGNV